MATVAELKKLALELPDSDRAALASHLLRSLPPVLHDEDEGIAEAVRRDAELDQNRKIAMTVEDPDRTSGMGGR